MDDRLESILRNSDCFLAGTVAITTNIVFNSHDRKRELAQQPFVHSIFLQDALFKNLLFSLILTILVLVSA